MPTDTRSGIYYEIHGKGIPLLLGFPIFASYAQVFGATQAITVRDGFLARLTDRYRVLLIDYPSIGGSATIAPEELTADRACADHLAVADAAGFDSFAFWGYTFGAATGLQLATLSTGSPPSPSTSSGQGWSTCRRACDRNWCSTCWRRRSSPEDG